jgi:hypothetical protein
MLFVRLPLVIAHPQLQRHGALNRVSANDETKRVSARVVKHPRDRRQTVALACGPERLAAQRLADLGERGRLGEPRSKPSLLRGGLVNRPKRRVFASTLEQRWPHPGRDASRGERRAIRL